MGEYERKKQEVSEEYKKYRDAFYAPAPGIGDEKRANHNREMAQKTQSVANALRELQAVAPAPEQAAIADAIVKTQNEAREFKLRAEHYEYRLRAKHYGREDYYYNDKDDYHARKNGKRSAENVDQATASQIQGGVPLLPVTIYLSEVEGHERVQSAVEDWLATADLSVDNREDPIIGSWFRRMSATVNRTVKSPIVREEALAVKHILDQQIVLARDADITARLMQNLGPVIVSLQPTRDAVVRVGSILIVKVNWVVEIVQLTAAQQAILDHQPHLAAAPHEILAALKVPSENVNVRDLELPKRWITDT